MASWFWMAFLLRRAMIWSARTCTPSKIALREPNWPRAPQQVANSFSNQFELPVLFYVLTILEIITRHADFVVRRAGLDLRVCRVLAHAYVHTTSNRVMRRGSSVYGYRRCWP